MKGYSGSKIVDFLSGLAVFGIALLALFEAVRLRADFWVYLCVLGIALCGLTLIFSTVGRK